MRHGAISRVDLVDVPHSTGKPRCVLPPPVGAVSRRAHGDGRSSWPVRAAYSGEHEGDGIDERHLVGVRDGGNFGKISSSTAQGAAFRAPMPQSCGLTAPTSIGNGRLSARYN
jgi:hypothetical protein